MFKNVQKFLKNPQKPILFLFILTIIYFLFTLFISDFNLLKILIFIGIILIGANLGLFWYLLKIPQEEKISFFSIFQNLLDYLKEGLVIYDYNFKIIFVNKTFTKLVGLEKEDLIGILINKEMVKNEKYETLGNIFFPFLKGEDLRIISQEPEVIEVSFSKPKEKHFLISYLDILLEKPYKLRIVLDKTEDVAESKKKLEFVQLVSHNLLTPLNEIRWALEAVDINTLKEGDKEFISSALKIIKNTLLFIESIFIFLRTESGRLELKVEEINLEKMIMTILEILKEKIEDKKLKVNVEIIKGEEKVLGDSSLIFSALFSLIENAVLYNKIGGRVEILIQKQPQRPYRQIIIKDSGIGMNQKDLENLFKKYYRGEKAKNLEIKGFGTGLYNAQKIITLHGGEIKIESFEDKGTTVYITLPLDINLIPKLTQEAKDNL